MKCNLTRPEKYAKLIADARWASTFWHERYNECKAAVKDTKDQIAAAKIFVESVRYRLLAVKLETRLKRQN